MKILNNIVLIFGTLSVLSSCAKAKDWKCVCEFDKSTGERGSRTTMIDDRTKKDAKATCNANLLNGYGYTNIECNLQD